MAPAVFADVDGVVSLMTGWEVEMLMPGGGSGGSGCRRKSLSHLLCISRPGTRNCFGSCRWRLVGLGLSGGGIQVTTWKNNSAHYSYQWECSYQTSGPTQWGRRLRLIMEIDWGIRQCLPFPKTESFLCLWQGCGEPFFALLATVLMVLECTDMRKTPSTCTRLSEGRIGFHDNGQGMYLPGACLHGSLDRRALSGQTHQLEKTKWLRKYPYRRSGQGQTSEFEHTFQHIGSDNISSADFDKCPILSAWLISAEIHNIIGLAKIYLFMIILCGPRLFMSNVMVSAKDINRP